MMSLGLIGKSGLAIATTSVIAAAPVSIWLLNRSKNMEEEFKRLNILVLEKDSSDWDELIKKYSELSSSDATSPKKIPGLELTSPDTPEGSNKKALQDKCRDLLKTSTKDKDYKLREQEAKWWCVKNREWQL